MHSCRSLNTGPYIYILVLQGIVPREAAVHVMMGKLHKRLRNPDAALTSFNTGESRATRGGQAASACMLLADWVVFWLVCLILGVTAVVLLLLFPALLLLWFVCSAGPEAGCSRAGVHQVRHRQAAPGRVGGGGGAVRAAAGWTAASWWAAAAQPLPDDRRRCSTAMCHLQGAHCCEGDVGFPTSCCFMGSVGLGCRTLQRAGGALTAKSLRAGVLWHPEARRGRIRELHGNGIHYRCWLALFRARQTVASQIVKSNDDGPEKPLRGNTCAQGCQMPYAVHDLVAHCSG